ncbi:uncharacterized protein LOC125225986 [Leguminivora glycinivorella]|uniref:uncharacterized protein LOC125225986 n=1 Tax=Leguminivora glycinivorella TaxID=1035111 RepID=UPI00200FF16B|nr:uncharacterized protein LOC125225986 [Leguminivora glycinivorella]
MAETALAKGLNFAPTPNRIPIETIITSVEGTIIQNRIPATGADCIRQDVASMIRKSHLPKSNMPQGELRALRELRENLDVLVLPADKGNATVIVDTQAYDNKIAELLSDATTYKKVNYNPTARVTAKVNKLLQNLPDKCMATRLRPHNPTSPKIYGLPKIHKPDWPLRPIVSQIDSPTYKLARHMSSILQDFTGETASYIRDSRHFINLLRDIQLCEDELMVSFDVTSLFTNVPVDETIKIISDLLAATDLPTVYLNAIELCLKSGYLMWHGDYYLQVDGVAMGSPIAPVAANIFMEWLEEKLLNSSPIVPKCWWRYVDDVFAIVSRDCLHEFTAYINTLHAKVEFTVERELDGKFPFLDDPVFLWEVIHWRDRPEHLDKAF